MKKKVLTLCVAMILMVAFTGNAFAFTSTGSGTFPIAQSSGSWSVSGTYTATVTTSYSINQVGTVSAQVTGYFYQLGNPGVTEKNPSNTNGNGGSGGPYSGGSVSVSATSGPFTKNGIYYSVGYAVEGTLTAQVKSNTTGETWTWSK